jgi:hypothetical protein
MKKCLDLDPESGIKHPGSATLPQTQLADEKSGVDCCVRNIGKY